MPIPSPLAMVVSRLRSCEPSTTESIADRRGSGRPYPPAISSVPDAAAAARSAWMVPCWLTSDPIRQGSRSLHGFGLRMTGAMPGEDEAAPEIVPARLLVEMGRRLRVAQHPPSAGHAKHQGIEYQEHAEEIDAERESVIHDARTPCHWCNAGRDLASGDSIRDP